MYKRFIRITKKILSGKNPIKIQYAKLDWDTQFKKGNWDFLLNTQQNIVIVKRMLQDLVFEKGSINILDVGCGNGSLARELSDSCYEYTGTDISSEALEQAKIVAPHGTYIQSSMDDPTISGQFDVIIFCEVLLYGDYERILKLHEQYLKPDGYIVVSLYDSWRTRIIWRYVNRQVRFLSVIHVKNLTRKVGWVIKMGKYTTN